MIPRFFGAMLLVLSTSSICLCANENFLLVLNKADNTLAIIEPTNYKIVATIPTGEGPHELTTSADGKTAFVANYGTAQTLGSSLSVIDLATKKELRRVDLGALKRPHGILENGGKVYFTCEVNRAIARYDPASDKVDFVMGTGQEATHMLVMSTDKKIYTANIASNTVTAFDFSKAPSKVTQIALAQCQKDWICRPMAKSFGLGTTAMGTFPSLTP